MEGLDFGNTLCPMETQEITALSTLAERLGWQPRTGRREFAGVHVVDLLVGRAVVDLIAVLAEHRER